MPTSKKPLKTIDDYIKTFPKNVQTILQRLRQVIHKTAPGAVETISYQIPTFKLNGKYLVYFAGHKAHVGLYPAPSGTAAFQKQIAPYRKGKGTLRFPLDKPIPLGIVKKFVAFRMKEGSKNKK
jgi:uncharacterized protein YdhG (YjbR/CyaY superfamily)